MEKAQTKRRQAKSSPKLGKLYVSFWNVSLDNFPQGAFVPRRLESDAARRLIEKARRGKRLFCVSEDDLQAPFRKHQRENHDALRRMLKKNFGITLAFKDFTSAYSTEEGAMYSINPLVCAKVDVSSQLLVVTCAYTLNRKSKKDGLSFRIAPDTVEFHLIKSGKT